MYNFTDEELVIDCFDKLFAQGGCSMKAMNGNKELLCAYRGDNGRKCAFGLYIPDELYSPQLECCVLPTMHGVVLSPESGILREICVEVGLCPNKMEVLQRKHDAIGNLYPGMDACQMEFLISTKKQLLEKIRAGFKLEDLG